MPHGTESKQKSFAKVGQQIKVILYLRHVFTEHKRQNNSQEAGFSFPNTRNQV